MKEIKFDKNGRIILEKVNYKINHKNEINDLINENKKEKKEAVL